MNPSDPMTTPGRQAAIEAAAKVIAERRFNVRSVLALTSGLQFADLRREEQRPWIEKAMPDAQAAIESEEHRRVYEAIGYRPSAEIVAELRAIFAPEPPPAVEEQGDERETTADEDAKAYAETRQRVIDGRASRYEAQEFIDFIEGAIPNPRKPNEATHALGDDA